MNDVVVMYTDGAVKGNGGPGTIGMGAVLQLIRDGKIVHEQEYGWSEELERATNIIAETKAVELGLERIPPDKRAGIDLTIHTDLQWLVHALRGDWKITQHTQLIRRIQATLGEFHSWRAEHVKGHVGIRANEVCNTLAQERAGTNKKAKR